MASFPRSLIPPPARWQGQAANVGVADYEPENTNVFMRLYYPTERAPSRISRNLWVPNIHYAHGMAHFLIDFTNPKRTWWQKLIARAAYLIGHVSNTLFDTIPVSLDAPPITDKRMPLVVFSHGLAGTKNMYSALCSALASQGYLVAAVEHRDGSASYTRIVKNGVVKHKPYVHTDGNFAWRLEQVGKRAAELEIVVQALTGSTQPRNGGSKFDISQLSGAINATNLTAIGHSFGGTTVLASLARENKIKNVVLLDPWTAPFGPCLEKDSDHPLILAAKANVPTFIMNSHRWASDLTPFYANATAAWVETEVHDSKHQDFSDLPLRMPALATRIGMKGAVDSNLLFDLKLGLIDLFLIHVERLDEHETLGKNVRELAQQYEDVRVDVKHK